MKMWMPAYARMRACWAKILLWLHEIRSAPVGYISYFLREWLLIASLSVVAILLLQASGTTWRADHLLYDRLLQSQSRPTNPDIIIIAIDNPSLMELGRWPWARRIHADLLERLAPMQPRAVAMDIVFAESEYGTDGDARLALAMQRFPRIYLPMIRDGLTRPDQAAQVMLPVEPLASAATAIGHIQIALDTDGLVRSLFLQEGNAQQWWPQLAWLMYASTRDTPPVMPGLRTPNEIRPLESWRRDFHVHIPYAGPPGHYQTVSYSSVLRGDVPAEFFRDKYVLIGATADGMNDAYPTPVSGNTTTMPGVEIHANMLDALLSGRTIRHADGTLATIYTLLPLLLLLAGLLVLSPRACLMLVLSLGTAVILGSLFSLHLANLWLPPVPALCGLLLAYPLWSWRRLEAVVSYFGDELQRLDAEPHILPEPLNNKTHAGDLVQHRITSMQTAVARVRDLRRFISDALDHIPDATLVADHDGKILLSNQLADEWFRKLGCHTLAGQPLIDLMRQLAVSTPSQVPGFEWEWLTDAAMHAHHGEVLEAGFEIDDTTGRSLLVKCVPAVSAQSHLVGWITCMVDMSAMRAAERQRDEMLRFLTHDMRSPQSSIIALLELQRHPGRALPADALLNQIERHVRRTLSLADDFVQVARAESQEYHFEEANLADLLMDALDEVWPLGKAADIRFRQSIVNAECYVHTDRSLLTRALVNLLNNAIKYSPEHTTISCKLEQDRSSSTHWAVCQISDQGYGISLEDQALLFHRFSRFASPDQPTTDGCGLGLAFVKTVIDRHHGKIRCESIVNVGTTFILYLPLA